MIERCIIIFPEFSNIEVIDEIRERYDPLACHVRPHITLVFPFESNIDYIQLKSHLEEVLSSVNSFPLKLKSITPVNSFGNYLFLNIEKGKEEIVEIHKKLYTGILEQYFPQWLKTGEYNPHMTVGKIESEEKYKLAIEKTKEVTDLFKTIVNKISVEIIDDNEDSIIEMDIGLK
ncbi:MAG: 2'-5' RNA ligase family protein [Clostridiaceae bacterium]|nr:2'-5' RNA ligase family protein [Clostridiaceae bacterium]MBW4858546.1 2'-5' RNA ligase family protein [Clostridiaceae bacterium]MBW4867794.1 2'-5' RNA ligase family protein [Clostridiaceae bacterium]MBW4868016.1 2'-5' RNA ligase family protein [Clostridiaceae bacterium]